MARSAAHHTGRAALLLVPRHSDGAHLARGGPLGGAPNRGPDRLHYRPARAGAGRARPLDPEPPGQDAGGPRPRCGGEPLRLLVDSTGLRLCGAGEWLLEKHGTKVRRSWRKLHIGLGAGRGQIVAASLTAKEVDDGAEVGPLLDQVTGAVASFTADGGYDQDRVYAGVAKRHPEAAVIVPPRATAVPSDTAETAPTQRDRHLQHIAEHGRIAWQRASCYTARARAEAAIGRFKQVIGDGLRSRTADRRVTEVNVAVHALSHMLELGRPNWVRTT